MENGAPALPDSSSEAQLWESWIARLEGVSVGQVLDTQGVIGSSPVPPILASNDPPKTPKRPKKSP